jgi:hypothetical protein
MAFVRNEGKTVSLSPLEIHENTKELLLNKMQNSTIKHNFFGEPTYQFTSLEEERKLKKACLQIEAET